MKIYTDTINSISKTQTLATHIKSLGKLELLTEDKRLRKLLLNCIETLQREYFRNRSRSIPRSLLKFNNQAVNELIKYCNTIIPKKKPEWQIIAIRHGWGPLNK